MEDHRQGDGYALTEIKWRRNFPEGHIYLYAKDYAGVTETIASIQGRDWRAYYRAILPVISLLEISRVTDRGAPACRIAVEGTTPDGAVRLEELYVVTNDHLLLLSTGGPTQHVLTLVGELESWCRRVVFKAHGGS